MRTPVRLVGVGAVALLAVVAVGAQTPSAPGANSVLPWAYPLNPPAPAGAGRAGGAAPAPAEDPAPLRVPGSTVTLTRAQLRDLFNPPDWHPDNHPPMPDVVARGRRPDVRACGFCHLPNGQGRPENSSLSGQPAEYIVQQMRDFRNGLRASAEPRMGPPAAMLAIGKAATDEESRAAAEYFASFAYRPWIRVIEADMVPRTRPQGGMLVVVPDGGMEPIGQRIIETPEDLSRVEVRDSEAGFLAYVPRGSLARGETLVTTGGAGRTVACTMCHGEDLRGLGPVPALAGRSPSYVVRQLYDMQAGTRRGAWSPLMKAAVERLTTEDMVAIAAYTASRMP